MRPSITLTDMLEAEMRFVRGEMADEEWERVMDWFAPWADMTGREATAKRWWNVAFNKINREKKMKPLCPRRVIDACFNDFRHSNSSWDKLDSLFSYVNSQEKTHTMFNLRSAMEVMIKTCPMALKDRRVELIREGFYQASAEVSKNVMACWILWVAGLPYAEEIAAFYLDIGLLRTTRQGFANVSKAVTTAMQKTLMLPTKNGSYRDLATDELAQGAYIGEFTGRANWIFDWDEDIKNRCTPGCEIPLYSMDDKGEWTEDQWWIDLEGAIRRATLAAMPNKQLTLTPAEHYDRRQTWMAGGSSGGQSVMVDAEPEAKKAKLDSLAEREEQLSEELGELRLAIGAYGDPFKRTRGRRQTGKRGSVLLTRSLGGVFGERGNGAWRCVGDQAVSGENTIVLGMNRSRCHFYLGTGEADEPETDVSADVLEVARRLQALWRKHIALQDEVATTKARIREKVRISKRAYAEAVDYEELMRLTQVPECVATGSQKLDRMKPRSIHGTTYQHYARSDYVVSHLEKGSIKLPYLCGRLGPDEQAYMDHQLMNAGGIAMAADHDDYDRVHSLRAQAMQYEVAAEIAPAVAHQVRQEWREECLWLAESLRNQKLRIPEKGRTYEVHQGGFTGSRDTAFRNDRLHEAYESVARKNASALLGRKVEPIAQRIRGDDILSRMRKWSECAVELSCLMRSGFMLNASKQVLSEKYGVFLRVIYEKGRMTGYAARSVGSLVMQPLQAKERVDVRSRVSAMDAHVHLLVRRGMRHRVAAAIWDNMMSYWGKLQLDRRSNLYARVPRAVISGRTTEGGWGLAAPGRLPMPLGVTLPACPAFKIRTDEISRVVDNKMSSKHAGHVAGRFGEVIPEEAANLANTWRRANVESDATPTDQARAWRDHCAEFSDWLERTKRALGADRETIGPQRPTRGIYVLAGPGAGKTTEVRRGNLPWTLDADEELNKAGIDWGRYGSRHLTEYVDERVKGADALIRRLEDGHNVVGAHGDEVTLKKIMSAGLDVVRVEGDPALHERWLIRRDGARKASRLLGDDTDRRRRLRTMGWVATDRDKIPRARNLSDAVHNVLYKNQLAYRDERTHGLLRVVGVRGGYLSCGEYNYVSVLPNPRLNELASNTQLGTEQLVRKAAELRQVTYEKQLAQELLVAGQSGAAEWVNALGRDIAIFDKAENGTPSSIKNLLPAPMANAGTIQYWASLVGIVAKTRLVGGGYNGRTAEEEVLAVYRKAFLRDGASMLSGY
ncbi:putative RNA-dependent RNA polymerase [Freshwater macrophyte associated ghabri-like virus 2]|nr:putative RNA-dependent RNA polymerase [Freshwater macrophyte associated ghabri-like virus 2]